MCMSPGQTERNRLSTYELKTVSCQNDSLPGSDPTPDEAQQKQGIVDGAEARFWTNCLTQTLETDFSWFKCAAVCVSQGKLRSCQLVSLALSHVSVHVLLWW